MGIVLIEHVSVRGVAAAVPSTRRLNADIGGPEEQAYVQKMSTTVGVRERRVVADGQLGSDLAEQAALSVLDRMGWDADSIDLLIVATQTPDRLFPGTSFLLHRRLALRQDCVAFDINLGCSAFTHGLWTTASLLPSVGSRALLINVDTMSRTLGAHDWGNQVLFGDAATATALEANPSASPIRGVLLSDGKGTESVCLPNSGMSASADRTPEFIINGPAVLGLALRSVPRIVQTLIDSSGVALSDVGLFVPHQANVFILDKLTDRLKIAPDRVIVTMDLFGNTSSASIPLALCAAGSAVADADREHTMMIGFGTGFSLSGMIADLRETHFVAPVDVG